MLYSTVQIEQLADYSGWVAHFTDIDGDREENHESLNPMGFYHYHRERGQKAAFNALKARIVKDYEETIAKLEGSLQRLQELEY